MSPFIVANDINAWTVLGNPTCIAGTFGIFLTVDIPFSDEIIVEILRMDWVWQLNTTWAIRIAEADDHIVIHVVITKDVMEHRPLVASTNLVADSPDVHRPRLLVAEEVRTRPGDDEI